MVIKEKIILDEDTNQAYRFVLQEEGELDGIQVFVSPLLSDGSSKDDWEEVAFTDAQKIAMAVLAEEAIKKFTQDMKEFYEAALS
jgi:hypothetical protein